MSQSEDDEFHEEYGFKLQKPIGEGSFGTVYEALHENTQRTNVFENEKKIPKQLLRNTKIEQSIMSSLKHPNIVRFLQVIETKQFVHLVMELIRNGSLNQLIQERKRLAHTFTDAEASQIMRGLLRAVEYMHSKQILHRDLKPDNILIGNREDLNSIKVADFGLSFQFSQESGNYQKMLSQRCGTFIFMAPEQLLNNQYSKPVDIWSCGVIMYMLFSMGKHPTAKPHETREHYIENLNNCQWQQPESMPDTANDFMRRLTCLNPLERYSAGQALMHPWITRKFNDEVPMNYQERILMFEKQINFAQRIKFVFFIKYLQKYLEKIHRRVQITSYAVYKSVGATTTDYMSVSQEKSFESVEKVNQQKQGGYRYSHDMLIQAIESGTKVPQSGPLKILQQQQRRRTLQFDRNIVHMIKNHLGTEFTQPSSQSSSSPYQSPKKQTRNFQLRVKEVPEISEAQRTQHQRGSSLSRSQVSVGKMITIPDSQTIKGKSNSMHYSPEKEHAYMIKSRGQSPKPMNKVILHRGSPEKYSQQITIRINLPPIGGSCKKIY